MKENQILASLVTTNFNNYYFKEHYYQEQLTIVLCQTKEAHEQHVSAQPGPMWNYAEWSHVPLPPPKPLSPPAQATSGTVY